MANFILKPRPRKFFSSTFLLATVVIGCAVEVDYSYRSIERSVKKRVTVLGKASLEREMAKFYGERAEYYRNRDIDDLVQCMDVDWYLRYGASHKDYNAESTNLNRLFASTDHLVYQASIKGSESRKDKWLCVVKWIIHGQLKKSGKAIAARGESIEEYDFSRKDQIPLVSVKRLSFGCNSDVLRCVF